MSDSKLLKFETYCKINCQDQLKQIDAGSERVNHVKFTFYLDSKRVWPLSQQPSHANLWRFHYERSQVPAHTNARGSGDPATSPEEVKLRFSSRPVTDWPNWRTSAPYIACMSSHVIPCQPKLTQLPLAEGRATATLHTTSGVIGW